jgi:Xaa-Pro aminopeptidase
MFDTSQNTPKSEIDQRLAKLQAALQQSGIDAALILQRSDLYYFAGTIQQANLYLPSEGQPMFFVFRSSERARAESSIDRIIPLHSPQEIPRLLSQNGYRLPACLGMELDVLPANLYFNYQSIFKNARIVDISQKIRLIRSVKSAFELDIMQQAAKLSDEVAACVPDLLREGMTELELAGKVEAEARKRGHQGVVRMRLFGSEMFYGHLYSGAGGALPSFLSSPTGGIGASPAVAQSASHKKIRRHEPVMVDYVFALNGYYSDHARVYALGKLAPELVNAHHLMLELKEMIAAAAKPGIRSGKIYDQALAEMKKAGYAQNFMGVGPERVRFVGHGIGLEVDEYPFLAAGQELELQAGMTIALEPKLIFPGKGVMGIENTHVVTANGLRQLSSFVEEIIVI